MSPKNSKNPRTMRAVALLIFTAALSQVVTLGVGSLISFALYALASFVLLFATSRADVRWAMIASLALFVLTVGLVESIGVMLGVVAVLMWLEAFRRQAAQTPASKAAVHFRSIQYFVIAIAVGSLGLFSKSDVIQAWLASVVGGVTIAMLVYMAIAGYCWWKELKQGVQSGERDVDLAL